MSVNKVESDGSLLRVAGGTLYADMPVGTITPYGGSTAPSGFLLCNGQAVSRTIYADLFKAIGTSFGSGDGSTTFNVPDLREATTKGVGLSGKSSVHYDSDGVALGEFVEDRIKAHEHKVQYGSNYMGLPTRNVYTSSGSGGLKIESVSSAGDAMSTSATGNNTNEVKAVGVNYIIKAIQTAVPRDIADALSPKDITSQVTFSASGFTFGSKKVTRTGDAIEVSLDVTVSNAMESTIFVKGLPKPAFTLKVVAISSANATSIYAANVLNNGTIGTHWTWANGTYFLHFTYTTAD